MWANRSGEETGMEMEDEKKQEKKKEEEEEEQKIGE